jgi:lysophospholipase L1-like esterase
MERPAVRRVGFVGVATLAATALIAPALSAQSYVAMGDSITAGINLDPDGGTCGITRPQTVSQDGAVAGLAGPQCGYPLELDEDFCGAGCSVENEGIGSETSSQLLARINATLDAADFDVLLLMTGTNDINGSPASGTVDTVVFNVREASRRAALRGIDTVVASIIHFLPQGQARDAFAADLRSRAGANNDLMDVVAQNSLYFADQWTELCTSNDRHGHSASYCFSEAGDTDTVNSTNSNHYIDDTPDGVGHPDADGFQMVSSRWEQTLELNSLPNTPSPSTPSGSTCTGTPTFTWTREGNGHATWYELELELAPSTDIFSDWYPRLTVSGSGTAVSGICSGSTCSVTPALGLGAGNYEWRVRGRSPRGFSSFSSEVPFTVHTGPPGTPSGVAPAEGAEVGTSDPTYTWSDVSGAASWALEIDGGGFEAVSPSCGGGLCSDDAVTTVDPGNHTWRVRASNCAGSTFSQTISFFRACPGGEITDLDQAGTITTPQGTVTDCEIRIADDNDGVYVLGNGGSVTARGTARVVIANGFAVLTGGEFIADN